MSASRVVRRPKIGQRRQIEILRNLAFQYGGEEKIALLAAIWDLREARAKIRSLELRLDMRRGGGK